MIAKARIPGRGFPAGSNCVLLDKLIAEKGKLNAGKLLVMKDVSTTYGILVFILISGPGGTFSRLSGDKEAL
jgi:hypothetical protein